MQHYDVAIIGGGLVGASLVHALSATKLKLVVIDKQPAEQLYSTALDNRGLALSYTSILQLTKIGVWQRINSDVYPIKAVHVSTQGRFGFTKLTAESLHIPVLGYVVSASALGAALIKDLPNADVKRPASIQGIRFDSVQNIWTIQTDTEQFTADLVVGADGTDSMVRGWVGITSEKYDPEQSAIVSNVEVSVDTSTAYERFTDLGIVAMLPFGSKRSKCVFTVNNVNLPQIAMQDDQEFLQTLQQLFGYRLGRMLAVSDRKVFPVHQLQAHSLTAPGAVLLGNSANTLHPVAAQGFNLGLRDALTLAYLLQRYASKDVVTAYASNRVSDQNRTREFTVTLLSLPGFIKQGGMLAAQLVPSINHAVSRRGLGTWI